MALNRLMWPLVTLIHVLCMGHCGSRPRVLINDGFSTHESLEVVTFCLANRIKLCRLPSHTSHKLQTCDTGVFGPLKTAYREEVERCYRGGANVIGKQHFTSLYSRARPRAFTSRNIRSSWAKAGLFPFNPQRVLGGMQRPLAEQHTDEQADAVALPSPASSMNMRTPTNFAGFNKLRKKIVSKLAAVDDETKVYLHKVFNATENVFADRSMLTDDNAVLREQNIEKRVCENTKVRMVGRAKVMSYEDIEAAQNKRDGKQTLHPTLAARFAAPVAVMVSPTRMEVLEVKKQMDETGLTGYCDVFGIAE